MEISDLKSVVLLSPGPQPLTWTNILLARAMQNLGEKWGREKGLDNSRKAQENSWP